MARKEIEPVNKPSKSTQDTTNVMTEDVELAHFHQVFLDEPVIDTDVEKMVLSVDMQEAFKDWGYQ